MPWIKCIVCKTKPVRKERSSHHLIPKWKVNYRAGKEDICIDCHRKIHRLFSNGELYEEYNTVPKLRKELNNRLRSETLEGLETFLGNGSIAQQQSIRLVAVQSVGKRGVEGANPSTASNNKYKYRTQYYDYAIQG